MSYGRIHRQIMLFYSAFIVIRETTTGAVSSPISIAVIFSSGQSFHPNTPGSFSLASQKSFEEISATLGINQKVNFSYKVMNSTFCDLGKLLLLMRLVNNASIVSDTVVLLLEDCQCEKTFLPYLSAFNVKYVTQCEQPYLTAKGVSAILQHARKEKQLYLLVPADAHGMDFYQNLSSELQRGRLKINRTLWLGGETSEKILKELEKIALDIDNNIVMSATFVVGFLDPNDFRLKSLVNKALKILKEHHGNILWIFPVVHLDFTNMRIFQGISRALAFRQSSLGTLHCNEHDRNCSMRLVLNKLHDFLKRSWEKDVYGENLAGFSRNKTTVFEHSDEQVGRGETYNRLKKHSKMRQHNCLIDVLQLEDDHYIREMSWRSVATWNGHSLQTCSHQEETGILSPSIKPVFRVPVVEYSPYVSKHELSAIHAKCSTNSLPCYGQKLKNDNTTVINYEEMYCCSGWTVDMLIYLTDKLSCQFELYFQAEKLYGVYDKKTGKWNGIIQDIISGKGDISVELDLRPDRCAALDCSLGYLFDGFNAIMKLGFSKKDDYDEGSFHALVGNFQVFLNPFHVNLLVTVLMLFNVFLLLIWAADYICLSYKNRRWRKKKKETFTLLESTSYVWATAFGRDVGDSKKPLTFTARYLSSWLAFLALIFINVYVARLMAELVKEEPVKPFTSLKDPKILNKKLKLGLVKGSSMEGFFHTTHDPVLRQSFNNNINGNLMPSLDSGIEAVKNGTLDGFIADTVSLVAISKQDPNCSLALMGKDFSTNPIGFVFRKDWPWAEDFKLAELDMNENKRNEDLWKIKQSRVTCEPPSQEHAQLTVSNMSGVFFVLTFGVAYCCFSLVLENIHSYLVYRYRKSNVDWNVANDSRVNSIASSISSVDKTA